MTELETKLAEALRIAHGWMPVSTTVTDWQRARLREADRRVFEALEAYDAAKVKETSK